MEQRSQNPNNQDNNTTEQRHLPTEQQERQLEKSTNTRNHTNQKRHITPTDHLHQSKQPKCSNTTVATGQVYMPSNTTDGRTWLYPTTIDIELK